MKNRAFDVISFSLMIVTGISLGLYLYVVTFPTFSVHKEYTTQEVIRLSGQCWKTQLVDLTDDDVVECREYLSLKYTPVPVDQKLCKDVRECEVK